MAATLGCSTARVLYNAAPFTGTRTSGESSTSSVSRLNLRGRHGIGGSNKVTLKLAGAHGVKKGASVVCAALNSEGDKVREFASEKAVESGPQVAKDAKNLSNGQSPVVLDANAEDASDSASYDSNIREKVVDVASDTAVDSFSDVDALSKKDAEPIAKEFGRTIEDTAEALEAKAAQVSDREAKKESAADGAEGSTGSFFKDQVIKEEILDVASTTAVDESPEVQETAQRDAADMTSKVGGDLRRNKVTIQGLADTASTVERDRSGSEVETGAIRLPGGTSLGGKSGGLEELTRTISQNIKEGIDSNRPGLEEISRNAAKGVKAGRENLDYAAEGAVETGAYAREALDGAKGALDKRLKGINLAAEEARETGNMVAELAAKGWDALTKTAERLVDNFQKSVGDLQGKAQETAAEAKQKAEKTADKAQSKLGEVKGTVQAKTVDLKDAAQNKASESKSKLEETAEDAQSMADELSSSAKQKLGDAQGKVESKAGDLKKDLDSTVSDPTKNSFANAVQKMKEYEHEYGNDQLAAGKGNFKPDDMGQTQAETDKALDNLDDEWKGKAN